MKSVVKRSPLLLAGAILLGFSYLVSQPVAQEVPERVRYMATAIPDRVILTVTPDPATSQAVTWRTSVAVKRPMAEIAVAGDGPDFYKKARTLKAKTEEFRSNLGDALLHSVVFDGLNPKTRYAYRVGDGENWTEWNQFSTASKDPNDPLTFVYFGDAQNDIYSLWSRVVREGFIHAPQAQFFIHAGDLVNDGDSDGEWGEWFESSGWINRSMVNVPTPGNHEYVRGGLGGSRKLTKHWRPQFTLPQNGMQGLEESSYYFDIQGVRVISLNSNEMREEQVQWLDGVLEKNKSRWTVLTFHHPIYSAARSRDNRELRELWKPVIEKHRVDLVLQGHDHSYARSNLITGMNYRSQLGGTVYVVSVSGPKMYSLDKNDWAEKVAQKTQLFQVIRIDGDNLWYEARTANGSLYDSFELTKQAEGLNKLRNLTEPTPRAAD